MYSCALLCITGDPVCHRVIRSAEWNLSGGFRPRDKSGSACEKCGSGHSIILLTARIMKPFTRYLSSRLLIKWDYPRHLIRSIGGFFFISEQSSSSSYDFPVAHIALFISELFFDDLIPKFAPLFALMFFSSFTGNLYKRTRMCLFKYVSFSHILHDCFRCFDRSSIGYHTTRWDANVWIAFHKSR